MQSAGHSPRNSVAWHKAAGLVCDKAVVRSMLVWHYVPYDKALIPQVCLPLYSASKARVAVPADLLQYLMPQMIGRLC
jgi:hypothetical protein